MRSLGGCDKKVINNSSRVAKGQRRIKGVDKALSGSDFKTRDKTKTS